MSKSDMVVLGFLHIKPMYGYEIIQFLQERQLDVWAGIKMASVYKALHRLEQKQYITGKQITEGNNPTRTVFSLTSSGIDYFRKILSHYLKQKNILSQDFWLTISFIYKSVDKDTLLQSVERRISEIEAHLDSHSAKDNEFRKIKQEHDVPYYIEILMDVGKKIHQVELEELRNLRTETLKPENDNAFINKEEK